jgi:23S rRNA pseudouridine2605 synthase
MPPMKKPDVPKKQSAAEPPQPSNKERIAKVLARRGIASRRDAEKMILQGRVVVDGEKLTTPAFTVGPKSKIEVDGKRLDVAEETRMWRYYKPTGLVTTARDPEGRPTLFATLPKHLPRVMSVGRLDINSEGLLLLTNDGGLARHMELPAHSFLRRYRVRVHLGMKDSFTEEALGRLRKGMKIDGVQYGPMEAQLDHVSGRNAWLTLGFREGKNREVRRVMESLGYKVNRLIRISFGPFQLGNMEEGDVEEIPPKILREQIAAYFSPKNGGKK